MGYSLAESRSARNIAKSSCKDRSAGYVPRKVIKNRDRTVGTAMSSHGKPVPRRTSVGNDLLSASHLRETGQMPWTPNDAERHTHKATTWELKELWAKVANECLERTGDEGRAIREANAVVARRAEASY